MIEITQTLLTIIIPCFNSEKYLGRCLASLENLNKDISLLFVNDGSVDKSKQIIEGWARNRNNVMMVNKENGGYASAINFGLDNCKSEYVMFLGADDEILTQGINEISDRLRENKPDILAFTTIKHYDDANSEELINETDLMTVYEKKGYFETEIVPLYKALGDKAWILFTRDTSRCYKRSVIGNLRYFGKTGVSADGCFATLVACRAHSFEFENIVGYVWHVHKDSVSGRAKTIPKMIEEAEVWSEYFAFLEKEASLQYVPNPIVDHYFAFRSIVKKIRENVGLEAARKYKKRLSEYSVWLLKRTYPYSRQQIKLLFPRSYSLLNSFRRHRQTDRQMSRKKKK